MPHAHRIRRSAIAAVAILAIVLAAASLAGAAGKPKAIHLTALVKKSTEGDRGDKIVLSLLSGTKTVGSARFPGCEGAGADVLCSGTVSIAGLGTNLETFLSFECSLVKPKCKAGSGELTTKGGANKGTITLKIEPNEIEPGVRFPVTVTPPSGK